MDIPLAIKSEMCPGCGGCCTYVAPQFGTSKYDSKDSFEKFAREVDESFEASVILNITHISVYGNLEYDTPDILEKAAELLEDYVPLQIFALIPKSDGRCYFLNAENKCSAYYKSRPDICKTHFCRAVNEASHEFNLGIIPLEQIFKTYAPNLRHAIDRNKQNGSAESYR